MVTRRLQAEHRTGSVRRPKTGILPTVLCNQWQPLSIYFLIFPPFYFSLSFIGFTYFLLLSIPSLSTRIVPLRFQNSMWFVFYFSYCELLIVYFISCVLLCIVYPRPTAHFLHVYLSYFTNPASWLPHWNKPLSCWRKMAFTSFSRPQVKILCWKCTSLLCVIDSEPGFALYFGLRDAEVTFSRTNSPEKITAWTVLQHYLISISLITGQF